MTKILKLKEMISKMVRHIFYNGFYFAPRTEGNKITIDVTCENYKDGEARYEYIDGQLTEKYSTFPKGVDSLLEQTYIHCINAVFILARLQ